MGRRTTTPPELSSHGSSSKCENDYWQPGELPLSSRTSLGVEYPRLGHGSSFAILCRFQNKVSEAKTSQAYSMMHLCTAGNSVWCLLSGMEEELCCWPVAEGDQALYDSPTKLKNRACGHRPLSCGITGHPRFIS